MAKRKSGAARRKSAAVKKNPINRILGKVAGRNKGGGHNSPTHPVNSPLYRPW